MDLNASSITLLSVSSVLIITELRHSKSCLKELGELLESELRFDLLWIFKDFYEDI